jgi:hypothetical protein
MLQCGRRKKKRQDMEKIMYFSGKEYFSAKTQKRLAEVVPDSKILNYGDLLKIAGISAALEFFSTILVEWSKVKIVSSEKGEVIFSPEVYKIEGEKKKEFPTGELRKKILDFFLSETRELGEALVTMPDCPAWVVLGGDCWGVWSNPQTVLASEGKQLAAEYVAELKKLGLAD